MRKKQTEKHGQANGWRCAFAWPNFALTGVAVLFIVAGAVLMLPPIDIRNTVGGRYAPSPGPGAFDAIRIKVAPVSCFVGFAMMVPTILYVPRNRRKEPEKEC